MDLQITPAFKKLFDLREGSEEKRTIIENVKDDADIGSARLWTLIFAVGVASVGLNINSIPVIVGAMLISPIMGPIVSMGMALSIYDWDLFRRSLRNLLILTSIGVVISTLYFALSPISNAQSELLARIQPTIFDVLIAIFGGAAGFIGISRTKYSNVVPGVAIATALVPPLCTIGYGIGTLQWSFVFGATFLFIINCIFICLSSLVVASYMKLPKKEYPDEAYRKKVMRILIAVTLVIMTPAIFLAYTFVQQNNFQQNSNRYIAKVFEDRGHVIIYKNIKYSQTGSVIDLAFLDEQFSDAQIAEFEHRLSDFNLQKATLSIRQKGFLLDEEEWQAALAEMKSGDEKVQTLEARLEQERRAARSPALLYKEAVVFEPRLSNMSLGYTTSTGTDQAEELTAIMYTTEPISKIDAAKVTNWLITRLNEPVTTIFVPDAVAEITDQLSPAR